LDRERRVPNRVEWRSFSHYRVVPVSQIQRNIIAGFMGLKVRTDNPHEATSRA
jgi:hypothetical protein